MHIYSIENHPAIKHNGIEGHVMTWKNIHSKKVGKAANKTVLFHEPILKIKIKINTHTKKTKTKRLYPKILKCLSLGSGVCGCFSLLLIYSL